jgi:hypothetical protein
MTDHIDINSTTPTNSGRLFIGPANDQQHLIMVFRHDTPYQEMGFTASTADLRELQGRLAAYLDQCN